MSGLSARQKGGYYHDGRFPTLESVINQYEGVLALQLTNAQKADLVQYLKSL